MRDAQPPGGVAGGTLAGVGLAILLTLFCALSDVPLTL